MNTTSEPAPGKSPRTLLADLTGKSPEWIITAALTLAIVPPTVTLFSRPVVPMFQSRVARSDEALAADRAAEVR